MAQLPPDAGAKVATNYPSPSAENLQGEIELLGNVLGNQLRDQILEAFMRDFSLYREEAIEALQRTSLSAEQKAHLATLIPPPLSQSDEQERVIVTGRN